MMHDGRTPPPDRGVALPLLVLLNSTRLDGALLGIDGEILGNPGIVSFGWLIFLGGAVGVAVLEYMRPVSPCRVGVMRGPSASGLRPIVRARCTISRLRGSAHRS